MAWTPLVVALLISYAAISLVVATAVYLRRLRVGTARVLLWSSAALGALSIGVRTLVILL